MPFFEAGGNTMCIMCCCVETIYRRVMLYTCTSKDRERNIFSDDITFNTVSKVFLSALKKV